MPASEADVLFFTLVVYIKLKMVFIVNELKMQYRFTLLHF